MAESDSVSSSSLAPKFANLADTGVSATVERGGVNHMHAHTDTLYSIVIWDTIVLKNLEDKFCVK